MSSLLKMTYQNKQITNAQCSSAPPVHGMLALIKIENNCVFDILNTLIFIYFFVLLTDYLIIVINELKCCKIELLLNLTNT